MLNLIDLIENGEIEFSNDENIVAYFKRVSGILVDAKLVKPNFLNELIKREEAFPTGIKTSVMGVAMPHVESKFVLRNALIITIFDKPVLFRRMDDINDGINVKVSFMLLIKDVSSHTKAISDLVCIFSNNRIMEKIGVSKNPDEIKQLIRSVKHDKDN